MKFFLLVLVLVAGVFSATADPLPLRMLSHDELASFREEGILVVRNLVPSSIIDMWREQLWAFLQNATKGANPDDPSTWPPSSYDGRTRPQLAETDSLNLSPVPHHVDDVVQAIAQMTGKLLNFTHNSLPIDPLTMVTSVNWPVQYWNGTLPKKRLANKVKNCKSAAGHVDGFPREKYAEPLEYIMHAQVLMTEVKPGGGGTNYFNRSHHQVHDYFQKHPEHYVYGSNSGGFRDASDWSEKSGFAMLAGDTVNHGSDPDKYTVVPFEFTGKAGDVIFWHPLMCHKGSINLRHTQKEAVFTRFHRSFNNAAGLPPREYEDRPDLFAGWPKLLSDSDTISTEL
jgi:ectoine hydroxylase-related dioxygenase (phytanoyl-CoA dioxygenase family)